MPAVRRRAFAILSTASALLCLLTLLSWARSYRSGDMLRWTRLEATSAAYHVWSISSNRGVLFLDHVQIIIKPWDLAPPADATGVRWLDLASTWSSWRQTLQFYAAEKRTLPGFGSVMTGGPPDNRRRTMCFVPHWFVAMIFAGSPLVRGLRAVRQQRRRATGRCTRCGYDLRATPERCPECGTEGVG